MNSRRAAEAPAFHCLRRRSLTDKFVSYTNANKEGVGNDVNRARFRFISRGEKNVGEEGGKDGEKVGLNKKKANFVKPTNHFKKFPVWQKSTER